MVGMTSALSARAPPLHSRATAIAIRRKEGALLCMEGCMIFSILIVRLIRRPTANAHARVGRQQAAGLAAMENDEQITGSSHTPGAAHSS
jgi:hypothetical protein